MKLSIPLKHQINYTPKCISFLQNHIVYGADFPDMSTKIVVLTIQQNKAESRIIQNNNEGLNFLKLFKFNGQKLIIALFESYLRVFTLDGKVIYFYQNTIKCNLAEFEDHFSTATILKDQNSNNDIFVVCTQSGRFFESPTKLTGFQEKCKLAIQPTAMITKTNNVIVADQIGFLFKLTKNYDIQDKLNLKTALPTYLIDKIQSWKTNVIIVGSCNGQIILITQNFKIATRIQCHANVISALIVIDNKIVTGSEDGCINQIQVDALNVIPVNTLQVNKMVTGIFYINNSFLVSYYDYTDLFKY